MDYSIILDLRDYMDNIFLTINVYSICQKVHVYTIDMLKYIF